MGEQVDDDEGLIKKPMRGSFQRVGERMAKEMSEKSPTEAARDDLGGSSEPTYDEGKHLEERVDEAADTIPVVVGEPRMTSPRDAAETLSPVEDQQGATRMAEQEPGTGADRQPGGGQPPAGPLAASVRGVRVVPIAGGMGGVALVGALANAVRRRRARERAKVRADRRRRAQGALGSVGLFAAAASVSRRSARRSPRALRGEQ